MYRCFDDLDDAAAILDRAKTVVWLNRSFHETFGVDNNAARGMEIGDLIARHLAPLFEERDSAERLIDALRNREEVAHEACRMRTSTGEVRRFSFSCRVISAEPCSGERLVRFQDVTGRKEERPRIRAESVFTAVGELVPYGIWICKPDGDVLYLSPSFLELVGRTIEECRHAGWLECIPVEDAAAACSDWRQCIDTECRWDRELRVRGVDGEHHTILSRGAPIRNGSDHIVLWAGINLDITARKQAERLTAVRAAQQAAIADLGQFALAGVEPPELMNAVVRAVAEHLGVEYAKVLRYLPEEDLFILEAAVGFDSVRIGTEKVNGGTDSQAGYTLLSHKPVIVEDFDAETRFQGPALLRNEGILSGISVIIQGDEAPYGVLGVHTRTLRRFTQDDINFVQAAANVLAQGIKRKTAEEALEESEEKFREIAQRSFDMIYTCYHDQGITYMSPAVTRILGYTPAELIGCKCRDYVTLVSLAAWEEGQKKMARGESVEGLEVEFRRKDGTTAFVELSESPIIEHGKVVGVQAVGRDITERKQNEQLNRQVLDQIGRNIEQFAVLGDHIRQPLQVILGMADLADDPKTSAVIHDQVERINEYIRQLDRGWVESREVRAFLRRHDQE
ncbi:PAS domain S-box protein [Methanoculleus sp. FWC-SCC3]|uniref:histidine kinase n=1 Tax=Methanoculleus methanifontis TaxID=2584086 RepID=A0ABT8LZD4_9EURY|nr:PAS domain S-box protein [Methanoculleus sp. FWC-SCC3]MDN7012022.1 PAS domain S-box protein [Methanoculleus sp. FWC-SCC3]